MKTGYCQRIERLLHRHVEDELLLVQRNAVDDHVLTCEYCANSLETLREERLWVLKSLVETPPLSPRLARKICDNIAMVESTRRRTRRRRWQLQFGGAAAALCLAASLWWLLPSGPEGDLVTTSDGVTGGDGTTGGDLVTGGDGVTGGDLVTGGDGVTGGDLVTGGDGVTGGHLVSTGAGRDAAPPRSNDAKVPPGTHQLANGSRAAVRPPHDELRGAVSTPDSVQAPNERAPRPSHTTRPAVPIAGSAAPWREAPRRGGSRSNFVNMSQVVNVANSISPHRSRSKLRAASNWDPCADSNNDGKTDFNDVAFSCQLLLGQQTVIESVGSGAPEDGLLPEADCEEDCLRV